MGDDTLIATVRAFEVEKGDALFKELGVPGIVVIVDANKLGIGDANACVGGLLHPEAGLVMEDDEAICWIELFEVLEEAVEGRLFASIVNDDMHPVLERLVKNRIERPDKEFVAVFGAGDDGDFGWAGGSRTLRLN